MATNDKDVNQHPRQYCYFCGSDGPIETHHIVPRRHDGSDKESNLVDLCPTCHQRLERLYDKRFYQELEAAQKVEPILTYEWSKIKKWLNRADQQFTHDELTTAIDFAEVANSMAEIEMIVDDLLRRQTIAKNGEYYTAMVDVTENENSSNEDNSTSDKKKKKYEQQALAKDVIEQANKNETADCIEDYYSKIQTELENVYGGDIYERKGEIIVSQLRSKGVVYRPQDDILRTT